MTDAMEAPVLVGIVVGFASGAGEVGSGGLTAKVSGFGAAGFCWFAWACAAWACWSPDLSLRLNIMYVSPEVDPKSQSN
jgi:hypothetical protein